MARIYVASSWRNIEQPAVVSLLRGKGHLVYDFRAPPFGVPGFKWSELDPEWENWSVRDYTHAINTHPRAAQGFQSDLRGMLWADTCVLVMPAGRSAHLEAGFMAGAQKRVIIYIPEDNPCEPELMYLIAHEIVWSYPDLINACERFAPSEALVPISTRVSHTPYNPNTSDPEAEFAAYSTISGDKK